MSDINWALKQVAVSSLADYSKNPRSLTKDQFKHLKTSLDKFGLIDKPIVNLDNVVIGGHQRLNVLRSDNAQEVECWYPSRQLTDKEVEELNIRLNKNTGSWDFDLLSEWDIPDLLDFGFRPFELGLNSDGNDPNEEWKGMPENKQEDLTAFRNIIIHFRCQSDIDKFSVLLEQKILDTTKYLWFPQNEILHQGLVIENDKS